MKRIVEFIMRNIRMVLTYDGARYKGWQRQSSEENTIQGKMEKLLSTMTNEDIVVVGCGRTDAGVHALNYVANFASNTNLIPEEIKKYCNEYLPNDIQVKSVEDVHIKFHSRYNAKGKNYVYRIDNGDSRDVFNNRFSTYVKEPLNIEKMKKGAEYMIGTHDFQSFTTLKSKTKSTVRTVYSIEITKKDQIIEISYKGEGFLMNMVRLLTGTLIEVGLENITPEDVGIIMDKRERKYAKAVAEAKGLFLKEVYY